MILQPGWRLLEDDEITDFGDTFFLRKKHNGDANYGLGKYLKQLLQHKR